MRMRVERRWTVVISCHISSILALHITYNNSSSNESKNQASRAVSLYLHKSTRDKMQKRNSRILRGAKHEPVRADPARNVMQDPSSAPMRPGEGTIQREERWKVSV